MNYYTKQLDRLDKTKTITYKFLDEENETKYCTLDLESIESLQEFLREVKIILQTEKDLEDIKI